MSEEKKDNQVIDNVDKKQEGATDAIPTDDKEILKKLQQIEEKIEAFGIEEEEEEEEEEGKKTIFIFILIFIPLILWLLFSKKGFKNESK